MSTEATRFTSNESTRISRDSLQLLWRFIKGLKLMLWFFPISFTCIVLGSLLPTGFLWMIAEMANCGTLSGCDARIPMTEWTVHLNITRLIWMVLIATAVRIFGWMLFEIPGQLSTRPYHARMIQGLGHTRTTYFDENPSGRLLNRLVRDYDQIRLGAVIRLGDFMNSIIEVTSIAIVTVFAHYLVGVLIIPLLAWIIYAQLNVSMMLQRASVFRSTRIGEMLHRETDVIEGARTFLIYDRIPELFVRLRNAMERFVQAHLLHNRIEGWGFLWTGIAGTTFIVVTVLVIGYQTSHGLLDAVLAGAILTSLARLAPTIGWISWITAYLLESVGHIRRVFEIVDLPVETATERAPSAAKDPAGLPTADALPATLLRGDLQFENYSMSYRSDTPLILDKLSVTFPYGKQIGVIGRTGAGKTSLMQSLFRMVYVHGGDIRIGEHSILNGGIDFARSHFAVVPQDPYLFAGTLRSNLDPYEQFSEARIDEVLREVGLSIAAGTILIEGGENLSRGERQLVCLARVLLGDLPFVLMDEPTSGVDTITDARIQDVLFRLMRGRTVITIAHRLNTLSQYDWIIELDQGQLKRCGTPAELFGT